MNIKQALSLICAWSLGLSAAGQLGIERGVVPAGSDTDPAGAQSTAYRLWSAVGVRCTYSATLREGQTPASSMNVYDGYMIPRTHRCAVPKMTHTLAAGWNALGFPRTGLDSCGVALGLDSRNSSEGQVFSHIAGTQAYVGAWSLPSEANTGVWAYTTTTIGDTPGTSTVEMTGKPAPIVLSLAAPGWLFHAPTLVTPIDDLGVKAWRWDAGSAAFIPVAADGESVEDRFLLPGCVYWLLLH